VRAPTRLDPEDLDGRAESVALGGWMAIGLGAAGLLYALATLSESHRPALVVILALTVLGGIVVLELPARRIVASSWHETFFVGWSCLSLVMIGLLVVLDGGPESPLFVMWFAPMVFAATSYPWRSVLIVCCGAVCGMVLSVLVTGSAAAAGTVVTGATLVLVAALALLQTRRQATARHRLAALSRDHELILASAGEGIVRLDRDRRVVFANPAALQLFDATATELIGAVIEPYVERDEAGVVRRVRRAGGTTVPVGYTNSPVIEDGEVTGSVVVFADVSDEERLAKDLRRSREDLWHQSLHDPLTGLPNRTLLLDRLRHALGRARRSGEHVALLFLDLDDFKLVNDLHGHGVGDQLLATLTGRLQQRVRESDTLARFGGDEFVVLCEGIDDPRAATLLAERLIESAEEPFHVAGLRLSVSACVGVAVVPPGPGVGADALIRDADTAMYEAKALGSGRVRVFDEQLRAHVVAQAEMEADLREALAAGQLELVYQPIIELETGAAFRFEALSRWTRKDGVVVSPSEFIAVAERTGLIAPLGEWVIGEACRQAARWHREAIHPDLRRARVSVNVSARQLADPGFPVVVARALAATGVPPDSLVIELTETALVEDPEQAGRLLDELRALGVRIALDDFGTGYSSLTSLQSFPLHSIKLDRSFVEDLDRSARARGIVRGILTMARELGLSAVAEGVERPEQLQVLRELGCRSAQGFLLARPMPPDAVDAALAGAVERCRAGAVTAPAVA
jgi:diguanylate cyclase (GGDEF)-like protein